MIASTVGLLLHPDALRCDSRRRILGFRQPEGDPGRCPDPAVGPARTRRGTPLMRGIIFVVGLTACISGCTVGPNYQRPKVPAPPQFRSGEPQPGQVSLGDTKWFDLFEDETLRRLIQTSLQANYDIQIAAQRVLEAQGQLTATRSALFPQLNAQRARREPELIRPSSPRQEHLGSRPGRSIYSVNCAAPMRLRAPICWPLKKTRRPSCRP